VKYLLDTCVLSELVKPAPNAQVLAWMGAQQEISLFVSTMSLAELHKGVARLTTSKRKDDLSAWLTQLEAGFETRALPFQIDTAKNWAAMCATAEAIGKPLAAFDSIIAATALQHGLVLVTRNVKDFAACGVALLNPWEQAQ
jgi:hypothetical protein